MTVAEAIAGFIQHLGQEDDGRILLATVALSPTATGDELSAAIALATTPPSAVSPPSSERRRAIASDRRRVLLLQRQARWRKRHDNGVTVYAVEADGDAVDALVRWGWLAKGDKDDPANLAEVLREMLADAVRHT